MRVNTLSQSCFSNDVATWGERRKLKSVRHLGAHSKAGNLRKVIARVIYFICTPTPLTTAAVTGLKHMVHS